MSVLKENIHLTVKFPSDIVRLYKCKGYTQLLVRARLKKKSNAELMPKPRNGGFAFSPG